MQDTLTQAEEAEASETTDEPILADEPQDGRPMTEAERHDACAQEIQAACRRYGFTLEATQLDVQRLEGDRTGFWAKAVVTLRPARSGGAT